MSQQKEAYEKKMEAQIEEMQADIAKLKAKSKEVGADSEIEYNKMMDELEAKTKAVKEKMGEFKNSAADGWESAKDTLDKAANDIGTGLSAAKERFS